MDKTNRVFVYGTLRQHESNHHLLKEAACIAKQSWTNGILYDTGHGYPAMLVDESQFVYGEVYEVGGKTLRVLDQLEGYQGEGFENLYDRVQQTVYTDNGEVEAYVYTYASTSEELLKEIEYGDWKCHQYLTKDDFLYFAYGSCMDSDRFIRAGVDKFFTNIRGCGTVQNFSLGYRRAAVDGGRADIVETKGAAVEGKVYHLKKEALDYLLVREGVAGKHYRPAFIDLEIEGNLYKNVLTFLVVNKAEEIAPPEHYAVEILRGAKDFVSESYYKSLQLDLQNKFKMKLPLGVE